MNLLVLVSFCSIALLNNVALVNEIKIGFYASFIFYSYTLNGAFKYQIIVIML